MSSFARLVHPFIASLFTVGVWAHTLFGNPEGRRAALLLFFSCLWAGLALNIAIRKTLTRKFDAGIFKLPPVSATCLIAATWFFLDMGIRFEAPGEALFMLPLTILSLSFFSLLPDPRTVVRAITLVVLSTLAGLLIVEGIFRYALLEPAVAANRSDFRRLISSRWPEPISRRKSPGTYRILGLADSFGVAGGDANYHYILRGCVKSLYPGQTSAH